MSKLQELGIQTATNRLMPDGGPVTDDARNTLEWAGFPGGPAPVPPPPSPNGSGPVLPNVYNTQGGNIGSTSPATFDVSVAPTAGHSLLFCFTGIDLTSPQLTLVSVQDNTGAFWELISVTGGVYIAFNPSCAAGVATLTVTWTGGSGTEVSSPFYLEIDAVSFTLFSPVTDGSAGGTTTVDGPVLNAPGGNLYLVGIQFSQVVNSPPGTPLSLNGNSAWLAASGGGNVENDGSHGGFGFVYIVETGSQQATFEAEAEGGPFDTLWAVCGAIFTL